MITDELMEQEKSRPLSAPPELGAAAEPVRIVDAPPAKEFTGSLLLQSEPFDFCPDALLDRLGFAKDNRPAFVLRPLNARQRYFMDADNRRMSTGGMLWAKSNNVDMNTPEGRVLALYKFGEFSDWEKRREIVRQCIAGFKNGAGIGTFVKSENDDGLHPAIFDRFPEELVGVIDAKLNGLASLTRDEAAGL